MIRDLEATDFARWRELFHAYGVFYKTDFSDETLDKVWAILQRDDVLHALVAEHDGVVQGIAHYRFHPDTFTAAHEWYLDDLFVAPESRGSGAATALIEAVAERAASDGGGKLRWITDVDNTTAQSVYDKVATRTSWVTYEKQT